MDSGKKGKRERAKAYGDGKDRHPKKQVCILCIEFIKSERERERKSRTATKRMQYNKTGKGTAEKVQNRKREKEPFEMTQKSCRG